MEERDRNVGLLFSEIARFRGVIYDQMVKQYDLTLAQVHVLNNLYREDGLTQKVLAERVAVGTVTVSGLVDRLEAKGLVRRETNEKDRRAKTVWLTQRAEKVKPNLWDCLVELNNTAFHDFTEDEIETFVKLLRRTKTNLKQRLDQGE